MGGFGSGLAQLLIATQDCPRLQFGNARPIADAVSQDVVATVYGDMTPGKASVGNSHFALVVPFRMSCSRFAILTPAGDAQARRVLAGMVLLSARSIARCIEVSFRRRMSGQGIGDTGSDRLPNILRQRCPRLST